MTGGRAMRDRILLNTFDQPTSEFAAQRKLGLELIDYLWPMPDGQLKLVHESVKRATVGISRLMMHGPLISPDLDTLVSIDRQELGRVYDSAYAWAQMHGVRGLIFHSGYVPEKQQASRWLDDAAAFWRVFLADKPSRITVYIENMVDRDPRLLAELCDLVNDSRLRICLDVGHAHCNSPMPVTSWVDCLGNRIGHMHLHNNDGKTDRHWALDKGSIDMESVLQTVRRNGLETFFTLECEHVASLDWLERHGYLATMPN